jgi:hypothetical protein
MNIYKIKDIKSEDTFSSVRLYGMQKYSLNLDALKFSGIKKVFKTIDLPNFYAKELKIGKNLVVFHDKFFGIADYAYSYHGNLYLPLKVPMTDINKNGCKDYIQNIPGLLDSFKLDRTIFKILLLRSCRKQGLKISLLPWRNLQKLVSDGKSR